MNEPLSWHVTLHRALEHSTLHQVVRDASNCLFRDLRTTSQHGQWNWRDPLHNGIEDRYGAPDDGVIVHHVNADPRQDVLLSSRTPARQRGRSRAQCLNNRSLNNLQNAVGLCIG